MRAAGSLQRIQAEQYRIVIHRFPEEFVCQEPFHGFTDPFRYMPHPAVVEAARLVIRYIESDQALSEAFAEGKMLGVLICKSSTEPPTVISTESLTVISTECSERRNLLYLAAFSGNVGGRSHIDGFVPPIYDLLDPSGHFKVREAEITTLNHRIDILSHSPELTALEMEFQEASAARDSALDAFRMQMAESRTRREEVRKTTSDPAILAGLIKESQFEKAELKRLKVSWEKKLADIQARICSISEEVTALKARRAQMSDELQDWIFRQYIVHNARGKSSSIADIFASEGLVPPGGTGECAAPKLLEYAYRNGLEPLAMGEFWYGKSPDTAIRTHGHFYPSCTSKCGPLLGYMLKGISEGRGPMESTAHSQTILTPKIIYEDDAIVVAEKPSGMPSVPGLNGRLSLEEYLTGATAAHRLDMDTSGVMVLAKTPEALANLQRQFENHTVRKTYMARISAPDSFMKCIAQETVLPPWPQGEGPTKWEGLFPERCISGTVSLPLSPDYDERPRQKVDFKQGKAAHTDYEVVQVNPDGTADLLLYPHTGRTHQLRVHCAHTLGLGHPILGDLLYGAWSVSPDHTQTHASAPGANDEPHCYDSHHPVTRLHLHALSITFHHPTTGEELTFTSQELCY